MEAKRKKPSGKQPAEQPAGQPAGEAEQVINEIIQDARAGGGEDLFPTFTDATDQIKKAFCGATFCLPKFKQER